MYCLQAKNIEKQYANHKALDGVSIDVPTGSVFGLLGPNGAGKTTLIRIITRITAPDSGEVILNGRPLQKDDVYKIGYLPEERGLYKKMKVGEQVLFFAQLRGLEKDVAKIEIDKWFNKFDIMNWKNKKVEELSKGMQQKIQFISTIIHEPDLLIFDEPFSGFDPVNADILKREILELKSQGKTIILSTHNMESVESICDNIALINHSQVVLQGRVDEIRKNHKLGIYRFRLDSSSFVPEADAPFTLLSTEQAYDGMNVRVQKKENITSQELIQYMMSKSDNIVAFEEELPTMNDIFIKTVKS